MPTTLRPNKVNKLVNMFNLEIDSGGGLVNMGTIKAGKSNIGKLIADILSNTSGLPTERLEFLEPPVIEATTLDINWVLWGEMCGLSVTDIGAATPNLATDIGFTMYDDRVASINGGGYYGVANVVLRSAADGGGVAYVEGTDYEIDNVNGTAIIITGGAMTDEQTAYVGAGTYTTTTSKQVNLLATKIDTEALFKLTHTTNDSKSLVLYLWKANITSGLDMTFTVKPDLMGVPIVITGLDDTANHASNPLGYLSLTT